MTDTNVRRIEMDKEFLDAVKNLTTAVLDFLNASDGNDDHRIVDMSENVRNVLNQARKIPALRTWAEQNIVDQD
jgi:hypothetical protein